MIVWLLILALGIGNHSPVNAQGEEYSIVLLPDTQYYAGEYPAVLQAQTRWIAENQTRLNIIYVAGPGDITNLGDQTPAEWKNVWDAISVLEDPSNTGLEDGIPYGLAVGNHDQSPMDNPDGTTDLYNQYFGVNHFAEREWYGGSYGSSNDSHYDLLEVGSIKLIVIHLEYGATDDPRLLEWADDLLKTNHDRTGIIVSHYLLEPEGAFSGEGERIYNGLKHNDNLALMLGGHNWSEAHRSDVFNGHVTHTLMADYSNRANGGDGWLQYLTFVPRSNVVRVKTYSPYLDRSENDPASDFVLQVDLGVVPFEDGNSFVPREPVFHRTDTQPGTILSGTKDIVSEQTESTRDAVQTEVEEAVSEAKQGWLNAMTPQDLDAYIESQMAKHGIQGISLAVTSKTEIIYLKGYGSAGDGRPMTPQTPMYIGSQSKSFTGLAIAQLIEQGKVRPNDPVQEYIPWFRVADEEASRQITVFHLLHHISGLSEAGFTAMLPDDATNEEAVRALASAKLTAPFGEKFQYFNVGYDVLAVIVQNVSGLPYEEYLQKYILDPLEMTRTYTDPASARENGLSQGYSRFFGFTIPQEQPHRVFEVSAGYIISTAEDMAHYAIAMDNGGIYKDRQLLSFRGMDMLFVPVQGYGMGWFVEQGHVFHGGANETFKTYVDIYPLRDMSIVLLINQGYLFDHYISAPQIFEGVQALVLGNIPPPLTQGWSVKYRGWGLLAFVLALTAFQTRNLFSLRDWRERARDWSTGKKIWDIAISFLIPTIILIVIFSQIKSFFGYRFNLTYQMINMSRTLSDITILMIVGSAPDYIQGFVKLYWTLTGNQPVR